MRFDSINILVPIRVIFALWAQANPDRIKLYNKVRMVTFWINAILIFGGSLAYIFYGVWTNSQQGVDQALSLIYVLVDIIIILIDYHWTKVIDYYSKHPPKRKYIDKKAEKE